MNILQIGANKGNTDNDPVWKLCMDNYPKSLDWKMVFVEPNRVALDILKDNYLEKGFLPSAISCYYYGISDEHSNGILYIDNHIAGNLTSQHASLDKNHLIKMGHDEDAISELHITIYPLKSFLDVYRDLDYLQIDTEGHDGKIILGVESFTKYSVKLIEFEYCHLETEECKKVIAKLYNEGYEYVSKTHEDIIFKLKD